MSTRHARNTSANTTSTNPTVHTQHANKESEVKTMRIMFVAALIIAAAVAAISTDPVVRAEPRPVPTEVIGRGGRKTVTPVACRQLRRQGVPAAVIDKALAEPYNVYGWGMCENPNLACSYHNRPRRYLNLSNPNRRFDAQWNPVKFRAGCR